jgi:hypothetical protein
MIETTMPKALAFALLRHAEDFPGLRLDEQREYRLHVWNPSLSPGR